MVVGRLLSYWEGNFSGAMLNFRRVISQLHRFFVSFVLPKRFPILASNGSSRIPTEPPPLRRRRYCPFWGWARLKGAVIWYHIIISCIYICISCLMPFISYIIHILNHSYFISFISYTHHLICHILYHSYLKKILYCSKKSISICLYLCFCLPWRSICVFSTLNGRNEKIPNVPNGPEALDNPQASTIRGNWPKISPKWASKVCRSARCVGCLVGCIPDFLWKGEGTGNIREKIVFFVYGGELLCQKFRWNLLLEIKWKFDGGGSDGVSVLGGGGQWEIEERKAQFEVWGLESLS